MDKLNARLFDKVYFGGRLTRITGIMQEYCHLECVEGPIEWGDIYSCVDGSVIEIILVEVCRYYKLEPSICLSKTNKREIVQPRQIAMYFAKKMTNLSLSVIGAKIGWKDHATVLHACKTIGNLIETDLNIRKDVELIERNLEWITQQKI